MGRRGALSQVLVVGALLLLVAIGVGIGMGNHVLGQVGGRHPVVPTPVAIATASPGGSANWSAWKRTSVMAVATDPGFPDPRVTAEPEVKATPKPTPAPKPTANSTPSRQPNSGYTSPPLPLPIVSHTPESPGESGHSSTLPPVPVPSLNP